MSEASTPEDAARRRAFAEVVEPEIEVMLRVARSITGSAADAEDVVQESLSAPSDEGRRRGRRGNKRTCRGGGRSNGGEKGRGGEAGARISIRLSAC